MELTFLQASVPLTKTYRGGKCIRSYPLVKELTSSVVQVEDLESFAEALRVEGAAGKALLKGSLQRPLKAESRAGLTLADLASHYVVVDVDYGEFSDAEAVIQSLPNEFHDCSYVLHYSSSYKITKKHFAGHLYFRLAEPRSANELKEAIKAINLQYFRDDLSLNATKVALQWPIDPSINEASRLIYVAPPNCMGFKDPVATRTLCVLKSAQSVALTTGMLNTQISITRKVNELREAEGLSKRPASSGTTYQGVEIAHVDAATSWQIKQERDFTYFNINGGDSWGYYHGEDPSVIRNFKGEPNYLTKELLPAYWKELHPEDKQLERQYIAFRHFEEDQYYNGWYDEEAQLHEFRPTNSVHKIKDFLRSHGQPIPDYITDWKYEFDFATDAAIKPEDKWINRYLPTKYFRGTPAPKAVPPTIKKVIWSVCGDDEEVFTRFTNWLAAIVQQRRMMRTAWVFNGVPGTGKGVMFHKILAPIFGHEYCQSKTIEGMEDSFNGFLEGCVLLMLDEFNVGDSSKAKVVVAKMKNLCVEPWISIRKMRQQARMIKNFINMLIFSNERGPMWIAEADRRFNVGVYQDYKLDLKESDFVLIEQELADFAAFLKTHKVNEEWLEMPLNNAPRQELQELTVTTIDECISRLLHGDFDYFLEMVPVDEAKHLSPEVIAYKAALRDIYEQYKQGEKLVKVTRDALRDLFNYAAGNMPSTPAKFTKLLRHRGMRVKACYLEGRTVRGIEVEMKVGNEEEADAVLLTKQSTSLRRVK